LTEKHGQIAHLDQDPANTAEENLAWLCLEHHSLYDSSTSQHKNYTLAEAKKARDDLYAAIAGGGHLPVAGQQPSGLEADRTTLSDIQALMAVVPDYFLRHPNFGGCSFSMSDIEKFGAAVKNRNEPEYEFIDPDLEELRWTFVSEGQILFNVMMNRLRPVPGQEGWYCLPTEWRDSAPERHRRVAEVLDQQAAKVGLAYHELIRAARRTLEK
jgi:hypothetical protein